MSISLPKVARVVTILGVCSSLTPMRAQAVRSRVPVQRDEIVAALRATPPLASKGRIQDVAYNPKFVPIVAMAVEHGREIIPHLLAIIPSSEQLPDGIIEFWPHLQLGDLAFLVLHDFFLESDWCSAPPGLTWAEILGEMEPGETAWDTFHRAVATKGRSALSDPFELLWSSHSADLVWNPICVCFRSE